MTGKVRAQSLRGYRELVRDLGGNPNRLLRKSGVDPDTLNRLTAFISVESAIDLLERSAVDLDCSDFGLRLAERQDIGVLGILAVAMRYSTTVGEAVHSAAKYLQAYYGAVAFTIEEGEQPEQVRLAIRVLGTHAHPWAQTAEHTLGLSWRIMTMLSEGQSQLQGVWFPHEAVAPMASYRDRFDAPLTFHAPRAALAVRASDFDLPISDGNEELHGLATSYLDEQLPREHATLTSQVRQVIETLLGTGTCNYRRVASSLHLHPRTLQRRLREEGASFEALKDETRRELAQRYLSEPDLPLSQISILLDYGELSAFGRSCQRWFGSSPTEVRDRLSSGRPARAMA